MQTTAAAVRADHPDADPVWLGGDVHGSRRLDAFRLDLGSDAVRYVLSVRLDDAWRPRIVSTYPHVPYDPAAANARPPCEEATGAFAWLERVHGCDVTHLRLDWCEVARTVPVRARHGLLVAWDTSWPAYASRPRPLALRIEGVWQPTVSSLVAATAETFREGYRGFCDGQLGDDDWALGAFDDGTFAERLAMIEAVLDGPEPSQATLDRLVGGPVEELIGHELLDLLAGDAIARARWRPLLRRANWRGEPPQVQRRLQELLDCAPRDVSGDR